jgi:hypothetical protein
MLNGRARPRLTLSTYRDGTFGLSAEVSFPNLLNGDNRIHVTDADMQRAFDIFDGFIYDETGIQYGARTSNVIRGDYAADFNVGLSNVKHYLSTALQATMPQMEKWLWEDTVYFGSIRKSQKPVSPKRRRPRLVKIYDKGAGLLRVETGFSRYQSIQRLAEKHTNGDRTAEALFTERVAYAVSTVTLDATGLSMPIQNVDIRIDGLLAAYPNKGVCGNLIKFMTLVDRFGQDFWQRGTILGYTKRSYERDERRLKAAGVWLSTPALQGLPALRLIQGGHGECLGMTA